MRRYKDGSFRLKNWDYGGPGSYFITICVAQRECVLGSVRGGQMVHSEAGEIAQRLWLQIPVRFPFIKLGPFVVMPNHIHGVLTIQKPTNNYIDYIAAQFAGSINGQFNRQYPYGGFAEIKNPMLHENISRVIRWYKGRCSFEIRKINKNFGWQSLFYDRIIRDQKIYDRVKRYVENNPGNWGGDKWFK